MSAPKPRKPRPGTRLRSPARPETRPDEARPARRQARTSREAARDVEYARLRSIDGRHPLATTAASAIVPYPARRRRDSEVAFFNFALARETGLLPSRHPDTLTPALQRALLDAFSLVIINEWDEANGVRPPARDRLPYPYMATRYLQLQHPDKRGTNSGDGRSIWNGRFRSRRGSFDVSSCGTGVTRLCPATSALGEFFQTGNFLTDYGCGTAHIEEGIGAALMSEAFARNGIRTERVLAVLSLPSGQAINVRLAPNLLRPSHFFGLLRRREDDDLRRCVLYYAEREIADGRWPKLRSERERIRYLAERVAIDFARATATFESEYIFCWLDWDGDNILTDASILDYGSVRQFGLYHHEYRFADTDRMSTSIPEQKRKAREIVQRFIQIRELLLTGEPTALAELRNDPLLARFDREFDAHRRRLLLRQVGLDESEADALVETRPACVEALLRLHARLERRRSSRGRRRVPDGLSWDAVYCMRDVLRELPGRLRTVSESDGDRLDPDDFYAIALSDYASRKDRATSPYRRRLAFAYQRAYLDLIETVASQRGCSLQEVLAAIAPAAHARNPYARMTGDGLSHATRRLASSQSRLAPEETYRLIQAFADSQQREASDASAAGDPMTDERPLVRRIHRDLQRLTNDYRETV